MAEQRDYKVLLLTSDPFSIPEITAVGEKHFDDVKVVFWAHGDQSTKAAVLAEVEATDYDLIISYINSLVLKPRHLEKARFGAINFHPAPPEHGGVWGLWSQPVIRRAVRTHHGLTVHEMDAEIDHGPIYRVKRWEVPPDATIQSVVTRAFEECFAALDEVAGELSRSPDGTRSLAVADERWDPANRHHTVEDVRLWFRELDPGHPAHAERVVFNHPRATFSPPYFDDLPPVSRASALIGALRRRVRLRSRLRGLRG